jgi:hypothetical protein
MSNHQDMSKRQGRTQTSADTRLASLNAKGHQVNMDADPERVIITLTRREGTAHHVTVKAELLPEAAREAAAFQRYPQSVLIAYALHTIADLSEDIDRHMARPCIGCGRPDNVSANYNLESSEYDWFCPTCFYGAFEVAV